jgi:hypothetical protein
VTITSGKSGTGNGSAKYNVSKNLSYNSRSTTLTVAGKTFQITQKGLLGK